MFRKKSSKPKGLHISDPILLPSPNPELPLPPPRPWQPEHPRGGPAEDEEEAREESNFEQEDEERDSQTLLDIVNEYRSRETLQGGASDLYGREDAVLPDPTDPQQDVQNFQNFVRNLQREAALTTPHGVRARLPKPMHAPQIRQELPLAEKILQKVARGPEPLRPQQSKHQLNLAEKRFHQRDPLVGSAGELAEPPEAAKPEEMQEDEDQDVEGDVASATYNDEEVRPPKAARQHNILEDEGQYSQRNAALETPPEQVARLSKTAQPQNIQGIWDDDDSPTPTGSGSPGSSPTWSHITPLSPNPNPNHSTRLPRSYSPQHDIRSSCASYPSSETTIDWNDIRFSAFARRTIAAFARNGRKRGYDPNDLITYEDMHRKKSPDDIAAEIAAAEALRDDPEQNERRFGLAWEWLNANSRRNESLGEAVVKLSRKRTKEDKRRAGDAEDRATRLGDLRGKRDNEVSSFGQGGG